MLGRFCHIHRRTCRLHTRPPAVCWTGPVATDVLQKISGAHIPPCCAASAAKQTCDWCRHVHVECMAARHAWAPSPSDITCQHAYRPFWAVAGIGPDNSLAAGSDSQVLLTTYQLTAHLSSASVLQRRSTNMCIACRLTSQRPAAASV